MERKPDDLEDPEPDDPDDDDDEDDLDPDVEQELSKLSHE